MTIAVFYADVALMGSFPDVDNIIKPIQDALIGVAYHDDSQVVEVRSVMRDLSGQVRFSRVTSDMATALRKGVDFVHISIEEADLGELVP